MTTMGVRVACIGTAVAFAVAGILAGGAQADSVSPAGPCSSWGCLAHRVLHMDDGDSDNAMLADGLTLVRTSRDVGNASARSWSDSPWTSVRERIAAFARSHVIRFDLGTMTEDDDDDVVEGRGKKEKKMKMKMKHSVLPIILGLKAKLALVTGAIGHAIALIAAKALLVSKIALVLGFFLFLKKLITNPPKHETIKHKKIIIQHDDHRSYDEGWSGTGTGGGFGGDLGGGGGYEDEASSPPSGWHRRGEHAHQMAYRRQIRDRNRRH